MMRRYLPDAAVCLLVGSSLGWGGHSPWATLLLELGAASLLLCVLWLEILPARPREKRPREVGQWFSLAGLRRTRVAVPLLLLTLWVTASLLPWSGGWLQGLSPRAFSIRSAAQSLVHPGGTVGAGPWSLAPFLTERSLCLWVAYLALFCVGVSIAGGRRRVQRLSRLLFLAAVAGGSYGIWQWFAGLHDYLGAASEAGMRVSGPFGNPNHYAASMGMLLLCSAGWMGAWWMRLSGSTVGFLNRARVVRQEAAAKSVLVGLGMTLAVLGFMFSLSRSGIAATVAALSVFVLLARSRRDPSLNDVIELRSRGGERYTPVPRQMGRGVPRLWALSLCIAAVTIWIGMSPLVHRFGGLSAAWEAENGRQQVWVDSLEAVKDFWLTGSGLGSFQHVFPIYRSFGGEHSYTHAHNDYLQLLVELGVPGFVLVSWLVVSIGASARRVRARLQKDPTSLYLHAGYCSAAVAIALHSFADFGLHLPANAALLSVVLGVVMGFRRDSADGSVLPVDG